MRAGEECGSRSRACRRSTGLVRMYLNRDGIVALRHVDSMKGVKSEEAYDDKDRADNLSEYARGKVRAFDDIIDGFGKNNDALTEDDQGQESTSFT